MQALDGAVSPIASGPPRARYECIAPKGAAVREGCELKSPLASWDVEEGGMIDVEEEKENSKGTLRLARRRVHGTGLFPRGL